MSSDAESSSSSSESDSDSDSDSSSNDSMAGRSKSRARRGRPSKDAAPRQVKYKKRPYVASRGVEKAVEKLEVKRDAPIALTAKPTTLKTSGQGLGKKMELMRSLRDIEKKQRTAKMTVQKRGKVIRKP